MLKQLAILEQRKFDDEDVTDDVQFLTERLQASVQDLSSFDEYATEVWFYYYRVARKLQRAFNSQ